MASRRSPPRPRAPGHVHTFEGRKDAVEARPLRLDEMPRLLDDYARAAENARKAGFDGVQLHGANGYLIDQFLRDSSNLRTDEWRQPGKPRAPAARSDGAADCGVGQ
jgi:2,4-dienoyl-CoA reductase-like NADH-dependent reductase (Old Yellow Enzyme family)